MVSWITSLSTRPTPMLPLKRKQNNKTLNDPKEKKEPIGDELPTQLQTLMPITLVTSELLTALEDLLPANVNRSSVLNDMISAYGLDKQCQQVSARPAKLEELTTFHDASFAKHLLKTRRSGKSAITPAQAQKLTKFGLKTEEADDVSEDEDRTNLEQYGLLYDCPIFPHLDHYIRYVSGSTITAARCLTRDPSSTVINWHGGRHHSKKASASGFCYVNDIVLGILELRKKYDKVVYLDLDLHHGDGVEGAFKYSDKVVTISVHRKEIGFFPGTGGLESHGMGKGKGYTFNAPMKHGLGDQRLMDVIHKCVIPVIEEFAAQCIVVQCGADGLGSDEHQEWNLSIKGMGKAVSEILALKKPVMLLGGGGYNHSQVARCWTYLTSIALGTDTKFDLLPDSFIEAHPDENYEFWDDKGHNMVDENTDSYIDSIAKTFQNRLQSWR